MRMITGLLIALSAAGALAQDMIQPIPKEINHLKFFIGKWRGDVSFYFGGTESKGTSTMTAKLGIGGRYVEGDHTYSNKQMGTMHGKQLMSYNPSKKQMFGYWFDSAAPEAMEMWGNFNGNKLVMISKPTPMEGMPQPLVMRATYTKHSATRFDLVLEMKMGGEWTPMLKGTYRKTSR